MKDTHLSCKILLASCEMFLYIQYNIYIMGLVRMRSLDYCHSTVSLRIFLYGDVAPAAATAQGMLIILFTHSNNIPIE